MRVVLLTPNIQVQPPRALRPARSLRPPLAGAIIPCQPASLSEATTTGWPASSSGATNPDRPASSSAMTCDHPRPSGLGIYHDRPRLADPLVCRNYLWPAGRPPRRSPSSWEVSLSDATSRRPRGLACSPATGCGPGLPPHLARPPRVGRPALKESKIEEEKDD